MACLTPDLQPQGEGQKTAGRYLYSLVMLRNAALGIGCKSIHQNIGKYTASYIVLFYCTRPIAALYTTCLIHSSVQTLFTVVFQSKCCLSIAMQCSDVTCYSVISLQLQSCCYLHCKGSLVTLGRQEKTIKE